MSAVDESGPEPAGTDGPVDGFVAPPDAAQYRPWPPAARAPATASGRWRLLGLVAGGVVGSALLAAVCAAGMTFAVRSTDQDLSQPTNAPTFPAITVVPFGGVYPVPQDLCYTADFTWLRPLFDRVSGLGGAAGTESATGAATATCHGTTGNDDVHGEFLMEVSVFPDVASAAAAYDRGRPTQGSTAVEGVGQAAYTSVDQIRGPVVTARDYNLTISMSWRGSDPSVVPETLVQTLANVCRSSLVVLRIG